MVYRAQQLRFFFPLQFKSERKKTKYISIVFMNLVSVVVSKKHAHKTFQTNKKKIHEMYVEYTLCV